MAVPSQRDIEDVIIELLAEDGGTNPGHHYGSKWGHFRLAHSAQHTILTAIWHMGTLYEDLGGGHYSRLNPERTRCRAIRQQEAMGYRVTLEHAS